MTKVAAGYAPVVERDEAVPKAGTRERTRVMQLVLSLSPGGTERLVIEIAQRLAPHVDMRVCCLDEPGAWAPELTDAGIQVLSLGRRGGFQPTLGYALAKVVKAARIQVVHCHHYSPFVYGQLAALFQPGLRVVFTEHGRLSDAGPSSKRRLVNPWLGRLPLRIFAVSADLRRHMIAEGLPADRIEVVYNGIATGHEPAPAERAEARRMLGIAEHDVLLGTAGRLDPVKDLPTMIGAIAAARSAGASWRLVLVGDGPERAALTDLVRGLGLAGAVQLVGYRADVRRLLPAFDLYLNSSTHEGVSLTILEAMAAGLPVIATKVGGNPEVVEHDQTGLVVASRNVAAMSQAIQTLVPAPDRRRRMGRLGRARVLDRFTVERMVDRYLQSYREGVN